MPRLLRNALLLHLLLRAPLLHPHALLRLHLRLRVPLLHLRVPLRRLRLRALPPLRPLCNSRPISPSSPPSTRPSSRSSMPKTSIRWNS